jgi:V/A-type H+-transporting ATPase subunit B
MHKIYTNIVQISGDVITVEARNVGYNEIAQITTRHGESLAQVIRLDGVRVSLQVFSGSKGISTGDKVRFLGHAMKVASGDDLLGRVFNGSGQPRDAGPALTENLVDIGGPSVNPVKRVVPEKMIRTGIPMIDIFNPLSNPRSCRSFPSPASRTTTCFRASRSRPRSISSYWAAWG